MSNADTPVVILAGGRGARFDHESQVRPKPLIEVAGKPILGHIMDLFEAQGFDEFIILGGYLCDQISDYVASRYECRARPRDYITVFGNRGERVKAHVFDTGDDASTGERLYTLSADLMPVQPRFFLTYGDGLADVDLVDLLAHHDSVSRPREPGVTLTAVRPPGRFGVLDLAADDAVSGFREKSAEDWINGGFMVVDRGVVTRYVPDFSDRKRAFDGPHESFETGALPRLAREGHLNARRHAGYWRCMDTRRDLEQIEEDVRAAGGRLPWRRDMMAPPKEG